MIRVELHTMGRPPLEIARAHIKNDQDSPNRSDPYADYVCDTFRGRSARELDRGVKTHTGRVKNFPRKSAHVWNLVVRALAACGYGGAQTIEEE